MSVSADMYIVISLMFAVFAAVAAVGTSVVLGAGFERLRSGFEIIKKQTGFFADAIYKLDQRTAELNEKAIQLNEAVNGMSQKVERVEKQTGFFSDAIHSLEQQILQGGVTVSEKAKQEEVNFDEPVMPRDVNWMTQESAPAPEHTDRMLDTMIRMGVTPAPEQENTAEMRAEHPHSSGLSNLLSNYFRGEDRSYASGGGKEIVYH